MSRSSRRSSRIEENGLSSRPASTTSRKRNVEEEDGSEESSQPQRKHRNSEEGMGNGGGGAGSNGNGGSGSGRRRSGGFSNLGSQDAEEDRQEFTNSQGVARTKAANVAAQPSKELLSEAKDEKKGSELSRTERAGLIKSMMRFLVMKGLNHDPATKKEMMDTVLGPKYRGKGVLKFVLSKAVSQLTRTLGLRVKTVASDKPYFVKDTFYVINALGMKNHEDHAADILNGHGQAARGLLIIILCIIYCSADKLVSEDELFKKLHNVDARIPVKASTSGRSSSKAKTKAYVEGLGDVHDLLALLVKQHYLMKKSVTKPTADGGTDVIPAYAMGARGALEVGNTQIVALMAQTMGETVDPSALVELEEEGGSQGLSQVS